MEKELLENIEIDKNTVVMNMDGEPEANDAPASDAAPVYDHAEDTEEEHRSTRRVLYALLELIAILAGTLMALGCAITAGVANLTDASGWADKEIDELGWWGARFADGHAQADFVSRNMTITIALGLVAIAAVTGLCVMTGRFSRNEKGGIRLNWFDRLWSELHIAAACGAATGAVFTALPVARLVYCTTQIGPFDLSMVYTPLESNDYYYDISNTTAFWYCTAGIAACLAVVVVCCVSLVKKAKARKLIDRSLIGKIFGLLGIGAAAAGHGAAKAGKGIAKASRKIAERNKGAFRSLAIPNDDDRRAARKLTAKYVLTAIVLIGLPVFFMIGSGEYSWMLFWTAVAMAVATVLIVRKVGKLAEIRAGVIEVKSGDLTHKISVVEDENGPKTDLDKLASDINHISEATNAAVQNEIKNQRLKTELISNVSHDLKTPLTSMISYLDILDKEGLDSPDAPAHLAVVKEKTERLRVLTEDLFEAAKASSGSIPCEIEDIDVSALVDQSLAEIGDRLSKNGLKIKKNVKTEDTLLRADGKLLYRVFENLLINISKYALDKSRVYIDVTEPSESAGRLLVEFKNISKDELNISAEELMERFTRGDSSRNTEGSGLGLAIARDLTTLMGGTFSINIDGDMFKASILLDKA